MKHSNRNALSCRRVDALASIACGRPHTTDRRPPARLRSARRLAGRLMRAGPLARRALPCGGRRARRCFGPSYAAVFGVEPQRAPAEKTVVPCSAAPCGLRAKQKRYGRPLFPPPPACACVRPCLAGVGAAAASWRRGFGNGRPPQAVAGTPYHSRPPAARVEINGRKRPPLPPSGRPWAR